MSDDSIYTRTRKRKPNYIEKEESKKVKSDNKSDDNVEQSETLGSDDTHSSGTQTSESDDTQSCNSDEELLEEIEDQMAYDPNELPINKITTFITLFKLCNEPKMTPNEQKKYTSLIVKAIEAQNVPSMREILNLNITDDQKNSLIYIRLLLETQCIFTPGYQKNKKLISNEIEYYSNNQNKDKIQIMNESKKLLTSHRDEPIISKILSSDIPINIKSIVYERYLNNCAGRHSEDAQKHESWINYVLKLPFKSKNIQVTMESVIEKFDKSVYGMVKVKEELLGLIASDDTIFNTKNSIKSPSITTKSPRKGMIIGLKGPPGTGKTLFARGIADALGIPFQQLSLGGASDASYLEGHGFTYSGSEPGMIVKSLVQMKYTNGVFFIDEVDKTSKTNHGRELEHSLLHILDFTQNHDFRDKYMPEIPIDLSGCIFVLSMNTTNGMDSALISRIPIINVNGYTVDDKITILKEYILPECIANYGFKSGDIVIGKSSAKHLIYKVKEEGEVNGLSGVRSLKYAVDRMIKYINLYRLSNASRQFTIKLNYSLPFEINNEVIGKFEVSDLSTNIYRDSMYS